MSEKDIYARWSESDVVETFARKGKDNFFETETHFLKDVMGQVETVLDVGCASGRFLELLHGMSFSGEFVGIDISAENIRNARDFYPDVEFHLGNALDLELDRSFDLVNATGVFQHDPNFMQLLQRLLEWGGKYVMFDVKFAVTDEHIADIERSFAGSDENRLYFCILNPKRFLADLAQMPGIKSVSIFGYETKTNSRTHIPDELTAIYSAGIFIEKGQAEDGRVAFSGKVDGLIEDAGDMA